MGCPVPKVVRTGAGSGLLQDLPRLAAVVAAVRQTCPPLTVKVRLGFNKVNVLETTRIYRGRGSRRGGGPFPPESEGYTGSAHWATGGVGQGEPAHPAAGQRRHHDPGSSPWRNCSRRTACSSAAAPWPTPSCSGRSPGRTRCRGTGGPTRACSPHRSRSIILERKRLGKLKAFTRFLVLSRPGSRSWEAAHLPEPRISRKRAAFSRRPSLASESPVSPRHRGLQRRQGLDGGDTAFARTGSPCPGADHALGWTARMNGLPASRTWPGCWGVPWDVLRRAPGLSGRRCSTPSSPPIAPGLTPNPCVLCNRHVKFGLLLAAAEKSSGGGLFASGHYADKVRLNDRWFLRQPADPAASRRSISWP